MPLAQGCRVAMPCQVFFAPVSWWLWCRGLKTSWTSQQTWKNMRSRIRFRMRPRVTRCGTGEWWEWDMNWYESLSGMLKGWRDDEFELFKNLFRWTLGILFCCLVLCQVHETTKHDRKMWIQSQNELEAGSVPSRNTCPWHSFPMENMKFYNDLCVVIWCLFYFLSEDQWFICFICFICIEAGIFSVNADSWIMWSSATLLRGHRVSLREGQKDLSNERKLDRKLGRTIRL